MSTKLYLLIGLCFIVLVGQAQNDIKHVEPPFWWHDMINNELEILIHGDKVSGLTPKIANKSIQIKKVTPGDSENYIFVLLDLDNVDTATDFNISLVGDGRNISIPYSLKSKRVSEKRSKGISAADAIYLLTPDRFRNGSKANDNVQGMKDPAARTEYGRHGGDLQGISESLEYIDDLGFNAIWLNPVLENDMAKASYHGYATTDYYKVDARFGGNQAYLQLSQDLEDRGMHLIMDMIANHCGSSHWWMSDLPFKDWLNFQLAFQNGNLGQNELTNHRKTTILDPYIPQNERDQMVQGWFVPTMPDLNQRNPHMSTYIIQNSIWWVEVMNLAGIRQDTYPYPEEDFLTDWSCALIEEYPNLFIVGEEWNENPLIVSYWQRRNSQKKTLSSTTSCLPSVMDFPLQMTLARALKSDETWNTGFAELYQLMINDVMYPDPMSLVIFPDNHDMSRIFTQLDEDYGKWKMAMAYFATMRGIPQVYYGTEVLMKNPGTGSHGIIRSEFPGGWDDHSESAFDRIGLDTMALQAQDFTKKLYQWRKSATSVHQGQFMHYVPEDGIYVYFRYTDTEQSMIVFNKNAEERTIDLARFNERLFGYDSMKEIISEADLKTSGPLQLEASNVSIFEMSK